MHRVRRAPAGGGTAPQPDDAHLEGLGKPGKASADVAQADDQQRLAAEFILAPREIADHLAPDALYLIVARLGKPTAQCEYQGHRVLGNGAGIDAARAGQADAALRQLVARELVGAGADRLDEAELFRAVEQPVMPQPGDHQHIGLAHLALQALAVAYRKTGDACLEDRKPLMQLVGDMGKADRQLVLGRDHVHQPNLAASGSGPSEAGSSRRPNVIKVSVNAAMSLRADSDASCPSRKSLPVR